MNRRKLALGCAAAIAAAAGVAVSWQKFQPHELTAAEKARAKPASEGEGAFWNLSFDTPDGQSLAISSFKGKPLLLNFWATWCPPCVEELPMLDNFYKTSQAANWQVLGLAVDQPSSVRKWLQAKPLAFPVAMAGLNGTELSKTLGNLSGSLPFTVVFSKSGEILVRRIGKVSPEDLVAWAKLV